MKLKLVCCLLLIVSSSSLAQLSREEKVEQLKSRTDIKVTEVEKDILKIEYPNGKVMYKNIGDYQPSTDYQQPTTYSPTYDSTIIDLTTIDTTLYYYKYRFWQEVLISNRKFPIIGDINGNGRVELYGFEKDYTTDYTSVVAKEMNANGNFDSVWYYNPSTLARNIYDVDGDGNLDLHLTSDESDTVIHWAIMKSKIFTKHNDTSLAINLSFEFQAEDSNTVQYNPRFAMLDGDSRTDYIYLGAPTRQYLGIYEYNPVTNSLDSVLHYNYTGIDDWVEGFAVDDFDNDNIPEVIIGGVYGKVASFESTGDNAYQLIWTGEVPTNNAYMLCSTDDIDRNGKKELWVGGEAFYNGVPIIKFSCFESNGNNSYQIVGRIDLVGVFTFYAYNIQAVDVDNDGIDELMICIDGNFLILKFNGSPGHQTYEVYYLKKNHRALQGENSVFWGATMYDLDNDGRKEILIDWDHIKENIGIRFYTAIYTPDSLTGVSEPPSILNDYDLKQNFPNPFNSSTKIAFTISELSNASLKVYDILGKEITILLEKDLSPGNYKVDWEAKDSNGKLLPSGVYLIQMSTDNYTKTIKALLLR
ncbi:MAG: T9SS type A sorting domain-containing protein [Ignavibacteriaceae bacterium]|nr:T9SS type A sorting domain-containing protein [Ignavibacteriaceae bacterium]